jgi:hypothetical protein
MFNFSQLKNTAIARQRLVKVIDLQDQLGLACPITDCAAKFLCGAGGTAELRDPSHRPTDEERAGSNGLAYGRPLTSASSGYLASRWSQCRTPFACAQHLRESLKVALKARDSVAAAALRFALSPLDITPRPSTGHWLRHQLAEWSETFPTGR